MKQGGTDWNERNDVEQAEQTERCGTSGTLWNKWNKRNVWKMERNGTIILLATDE